MFVNDSSAVLVNACRVEEGARGSEARGGRSGAPAQEDEARRQDGRRSRRRRRRPRALHAARGGHWGALATSSPSTSLRPLRSSSLLRSLRPTRDAGAVAMAMAIGSHRSDRAAAACGLYSYLYSILCIRPVSRTCICIACVCAGGAREVRGARGVRARRVQAGAHRGARALLLADRRAASFPRAPALLSFCVLSFRPIRPILLRPTPTRRILHAARHCAAMRSFRRSRRRDADVSTVDHIVPL